MEVNYGLSKLPDCIKSKINKVKNQVTLMIKMGTDCDFIEEGDYLIAELHLTIAAIKAELLKQKKDPSLELLETIEFLNSIADNLEAIKETIEESLNFYRIKAVDENEDLKKEMFLKTTQENIQEHIEYQELLALKEELKLSISLRDKRIIHFLNQKKDNLTQIKLLEKDRMDITNKNQVLLKYQLISVVVGMATMGLIKILETFSQSEIEELYHFAVAALSSVVTYKLISKKYRQKLKSGINCLLAETIEELENENSLINIQLDKNNVEKSKTNNEVYLTEVQLAYAYDELYNKREDNYQLTKKQLS